MATTTDYDLSACCCGSSPSGSPCCVGGQPTASSLTATFNSVAFCACLNGATCTLTWNSGISKWTGSTTPGTCGHVYELTFWCDAATSTFKLTVHHPSGCKGDVTINGGTPTCSPVFQVGFSPINGYASVCGCTAGMVPSSYGVVVA